MKLKNKVLKRDYFIPLTEDKLFKEIFSQKKYRKFLEDLLETYLGLERYTLKNKLHVNKEVILSKSNYYDKNLRTDLFITFANVILNIEMYSVFTNESLRKSSQYVMRIYATQLGIGDNYNEVKKVTQINFVDNVRVKITDELVSSTTIGDVTQDIVRLDIVRKIEYNKNDRFILWLKYLSAKTKEERESIARGDEVLMELEENINEYLKNADELWWETFNDDYWNKRIYKEYGEELGIEKGKIEGVKETIKNMLQDNMSLEDISKYVNLSEEEIKEILEGNI